MIKTFGIERGCLAAAAILTFPFRRKRERERRKKEGVFQFRINIFGIVSLSSSSGAEVSPPLPTTIQPSSPPPSLGAARIEKKKKAPRSNGEEDRMERPCIVEEKEIGMIVYVPGGERALLASCSLGFILWAKTISYWMVAAWLW